MKNKKHVQVAKAVPNVTAVAVKNMTAGLKIIADAYASMESQFWFKKAR